MSRQSEELLTFACRYAPLVASAARCLRCKARSSTTAQARPGSSSNATHFRWDQSIDTQPRAWNLAAGRQAHCTSGAIAVSS